MNADIPVETIAENANRWVVLTWHKLVHPMYGEGVGEIVGGEPRDAHLSLDAAVAEARKLVADAARPLPEGATRQSELADVRVRAYHQRDVVWTAPLSGPDWDEAWATGPGADPREG